ncbi:hypothetical protein PsorP6_006407 [Peronosclerospora sorghi]|uniref:Uncharacterized protein n=1 Tax=Peronosclerospora sorghi TaxID=230839 RepID=A0ACC0W531_9STRA|nr:hypothetical protein PsorP6_006407 [Peronosclerospora sorghi]
MFIPGEITSKIIRAPFLLWSDIILQCVTKTNEKLKNRYLLLKTALDEELVFIHVVYAPDEPRERREFFQALPTDLDDYFILFDDSNDCAPTIYHIVIGDLNETIDSHMDQQLPGLHHPGTGCIELTNWLEKLGIIDSWRFINPDTRDFTSTKRNNGLDYCFLTPDFLQHHLKFVRHVRDKKWHNEDHIEGEFWLRTKIVPRGKQPTWRCTTWLLKVSTDQKFLAESVTALACRLRSRSVLLQDR